MAEKRQERENVYVAQGEAKMTKCEKCNTWIISGKATCSACTDTLAQMRAKVAEHKERNPCPLTDAAAQAATLKVDAPVVNHARKLERELAEAKERAEAAERKVAELQARIDAALAKLGE